MLTVGQIALRMCDRLEIQPSSVYAQTKLFGFIQEAYKEIWDSQDWSELVGDDFNINLPANSLILTLDKSHGAILRAYNEGTGQPIKLRDRSSFSDTAYVVGAQYTQDIVFDSITQLSPSPVLNQLSAAQNVNVVSSSAVDATALAYQIFIQGIVNGQLVNEVLTLNGTTNVPSANIYTSIVKWSKNQLPTNGTILLLDNSANTLATLGPWETTPQYLRYQIDGSTSYPAGITLTCKKPFVPFQNNFDYPFTEMDALLIRKSMAIAWEEHNKLEMSAQVERTAQAAMDKLVDREMNQDDVILFCPSQRG
jgi:hypothetical protein